MTSPEVKNGGGKIDLQIVLSPSERKTYQQMLKALRTKPKSDVLIGGRNCICQGGRGGKRRK